MIHTINHHTTNHVFPIAIVVSRFNEEITTKLLEGALSRLKERGFLESQILVVWVPGAVEIPITAQTLAETGRYQAIITLGAVVRGETTHYDYVCNIVADGCREVMMATRTPVIFGVLTTENEAQAFDRLGGAHGHKGRDAADTAIEMASVLNQIKIR